MDKIVLITGATSGIGEACSALFASRGYKVIICGRRLARLEKVALNLESTYNTKVQILCFDVSKKEDVEKSLQLLPAEWKKVDILINSAGLSLGLGPFQNGEWNDWETMIDTNIKGLLYVSKIISNWMIKNNSGHIINLGSIAGREVIANGNGYAATKHAVDAITKSMRLDFLEYGIKVTAIHPGSVKTEFSEVRFKGDLERAEKVYEGFEPLTALDIAETIWFTATRPKHVTINELIIMPTAQANATTIFRGTPGF